MALSHLRRAVAANDGNAQAHLNLGLVQMTLQNYAQALAELERAVELDPDLGPTLAELIATARERAGQ